MPRLKTQTTALLFLAALIPLSGQACPADAGSVLPVPQGLQGGTGGQGPQGEPGADGSDATLTAGDGLNITNGQVSLDTAFTDSLYWKLLGNDGTTLDTDFLGTTDETPLDLRAFNRRALRLEWARVGVPNQPTNFDIAPNFIAGYDGNSVGRNTVGATVFGGGEFDNNGVITPLPNSARGSYSLIGGGYNNRTEGTASVIAGGILNLTTGDTATIGGGSSNLSSGFASSIAGGSGNTASSLFATVGGGNDNLASNNGATVGGGLQNQATGANSCIPGGLACRATGFNSFAAGYNARANHNGTFVWADDGQGLGLTTSSIDDHQFFVATTGGVRLSRTDANNPYDTIATYATEAAVMIEKLNPGGEALWIWSRQVENSAPVVKMHRNPSGTNDFVQGRNWAGTPGSPAPVKFRIDQNGAYTGGSDFAEALPVLGDKSDYEFGDVLVLSDQPGVVEKCAKANDTRVAGVYSTRPAVIGAEKEGESRVDENDVPVAIVGIVPTKVSAENGPIQIGDLLTTAPTPGHAMRASPIRIGDIEIHPPGAILGKAMQNLESGTDLIKVLVTLK